MNVTPPLEGSSDSRASDAEEPRAQRSAPPAGPLYLPDDIIAQKYRLSRMIGEGGMGAVWLARNIKLDVDVAIKLIRHELGTAEASDRLLQEARAAARIEHRSIVRVFDFGETELDDPFIVMEILTGESLRELLDRKGRLPAANAVRTLLPIASALVEAHASGIVHRDLKPENVMLVPDKSGGAVPKLLDFGIAKFVDKDKDVDADDTGRARLAVGTPDYMAPEQAGGHDEVGEQADVWALSVMLYEAITGKVPFSGPNYQALIFAIMTADAVATHDQLAGDAELWEILKGGLAKRDVERPTMLELGRALARWAIERGIDSDIAGTSLSAHWARDTTQRPFSVLPPSRDDWVIPKPARLPGALGSAGQLAPTDAPPGQEPVEPETAPSKGAIDRRAMWIGAAVIAAAAAVAMALRGPSGAEQRPILTVKSAPVAPPSGAPLIAEPPASAAEASPEASPTAAASASESASAARPEAPSRALPAYRKPPPKRHLPIAKQPNF